MYFYLCVCEYMQVRVSTRRVQEVVAFPGARVTSSCEPPSVVLGKQQAPLTTNNAWYNYTLNFS